MARAITLAVVAGLLTAISSVCQRRGATHVETTSGFSPRLVLRLLGEPIWLLGVGSMILGFICQATALHFGSLALVQPILASELLFVFGYIALVSPSRVRLTDWLAAGAMAAGLGLFLFAASPSGGQAHAPATLWFLAGISGLGLIALLVIGAYAPLRRGTVPSAGRRAAFLGVATGVSWGFLAAVIKELSSHTENGVSGIFSTWSLYVLIGVGAASMILSSNALHAGPLAASQPGFTIVDPLVASLLGVFIFKVRLQVHPLQMAVEVVALALLGLGVLALSHSGLIHNRLTDEDDTGAAPAAPDAAFGPAGSSTEGSR